MSEAQKLRPPEAWQNSLALAREKHTKEKTLSSCRWLFNSYRRSAKTRGIEFNITLDEFVNVTRQDCHYCGEAPSNFIRDHMERLNGAYVFNGIDRVNNDIGYVKDNVVPCCKACNYAKRKMTVEEFLEWARRVYAHSIAIKSD